MRSLHVRQGAGHVGLLARHVGLRRDDSGLGADYVSLGRHHGRLVGKIVLDRVVQLLLADGAILGQGCVAVDVERGPALIGLSPGHVGLSLADQGVGLVHPRFGLFDLGPGLQNLGFRLLELGPRLVEGGLIGTGIDLEQQISLADEGAFLVVLAHEVTGHQRANLGVDVAGRGADPFAVNRHVTLNDGGHVDLQRRG